MDSLSAASQILSQMKEFSEGMTLLRQDVDRLMRASSLQRDQSTNPGSGAADNMTSELVPPAPPPSNSESANAMVLEPPHRIPGTTWAEEMDMISPLVDDETPPGTTPTIQVVPVSERTNKFLNEAFAMKLTPVQRKTLRSQYYVAAERTDEKPNFGHNVGVPMFQYHQIYGPHPVVAARQRAGSRRAALPTAGGY